MLVAEKQQYTESYYPRVLDKEETRLNPQPRVIPKSKPRARKKVLPVIVVLIGFSLCAYIVSGFAVIAQKQEEIISLEETLEEQRGIQEHLELDLLASSDLQRIEEFAKTDLDMNYPDKEQVLFVELPEPKTKDDTSIAMEVDQKDSLWSKIVGLLD
ncbi:MAG TPA: cell division protein FtsL [Clostridia bacterium]|nr:cell division protein FtsL [Clostridia bacterium]